MTTPIVPIGTTASPPPTSAANGVGGLGADTFLKLLVAQLKYQNPMSPTDPSAFLAQSAQFTMVEKLGQIAEKQDILAAGSGVLSGAALIGKTVTWDDGNAAQPSSGIVDRVELDPDGGAVVRIGDKSVPMDAIREIKNT